MYKFLRVITILLPLTLLTLILNATEPEWEHDYNKALQRAKKENKLVYLFIGADECPYCEKFKQQTLSDKKLIERMKKAYILLYMSRDRHKIPDGYVKYGVPMHYFLTPDGKTVAQIQGGRELPGWYDVLDEIELLREK